MNALAILLVYNHAYTNLFMGVSIVQKTQTDLSEDSFIDMKYITNDSGFTAKYFYSLIKKGDFPAPIKFGRSSRWLMNDYTLWKKKHIEKRGD